MSLTAAVYHPRNPKSSDYYRCVEDYFETFVQIYDEHFSRQYGFWRPYIEQVIYRYLDCGNLHLPILPPEAGGGIRGMAMPGCPQEDSPPAFRIQHPENPPPLLSRSLSPT